MRLIYNIIFIYIDAFVNVKSVFYYHYYYFTIIMNEFFDIYFYFN